VEIFITQGGVLNPSQYAPWKIPCCFSIEVIVRRALKKLEKNIIIAGLDNLLGEII